MRQTIHLGIVCSSKSTIFCKLMIAKVVKATGVIACYIIALTLVLFNASLNDGMFMYVYKEEALFRNLKIGSRNE